MLNENLYREVLIKPASKGGDKLHIVSGYATAAMAFKHITHIKELNDKIKVHLIVGMCSAEGISLSNHRGFVKLVEEDFPSNFVCMYLRKLPPVHSKVYVWHQGRNPMKAFLGSANYSQHAFSKNQRELMEESDVQECYDYFREIESQSIQCNHSQAEEFITILNDRVYRERAEALADSVEVSRRTAPHLLGLPTVTVSLLDNKGNLPTRSGLNWGQRPELHRNPNQAYIRLPSTIYKSDFFPPRTVHFTVLTDDNKTLTCTTAQANGKAIHTPHNNSLIGEYFRTRLGIASGRLITKQDLLNHGRTDVNFYKIDDETFYLDFST